MRTHRLVLRKETLAPLDAAELQRVAGAASVGPVCVYLTLGLVQCDSLVRACPGISNTCT